MNQQVKPTVSDFLHAWEFWVYQVGIVSVYFALATLLFLIDATVGEVLAAGAIWSAFGLPMSWLALWVHNRRTA